MPTLNPHAFHFVYLIAHPRQERSTPPEAVCCVLDEELLAWPMGERRWCVVPSFAQTAVAAWSAERSVACMLPPLRADAPAGASAPMDRELALGAPLALVVAWGCDSRAGRLARWSREAWGAAPELVLIEV